MPRILFVDQSKVLGGAELSLIDIARGFPDSAVAVFEGGEFSDRLRDLGIPVFVLSGSDELQKVTRGGGILSSVMALPALFVTARKIAAHARDFDIIYANTQKAMLTAAVAGKLAGKPVVWHLRDLMTTDHFSTSHINASVKTANLLVARIIANSHATHHAFITSGGAESKTVTIHNGIDAEPFVAIDSELVEQTRNELGLDGKVVAGFFSRLSDWKGQHILLEAIREKPEWNALIVGGALFQEDHLYEDRLRKMVDEFGLHDRVQFLGFRDDIPVLMSLVDVVVHASTSAEPFGRVIVEGMLARTPVVASNGGGAAEIINHGKTGFLFEPGDVAGLSKVLGQITRDKEGVQRMSEAALEEALDYYSVERLLKDVSHELNSVLV